MGILLTKALMCGGNFGTVQSNNQGRMTNDKYKTKISKTKTKEDTIV